MIKIMKKPKGLTLIEMVMSIAIMLVVVATASIVMGSGHKIWNKLWKSVHGPVRRDSDYFTILFGSLGRESNRLEYRLYKITDSGAFIESVANGDQQELVSGDAVEFVYWDVPLDSSDSHNLLDTSKKGTRYAIIYPEGDKLKIDYSSYPPAAVIGGSKRNNPDRTAILMENVSSVEFTHTTVSKLGQGCVRAVIELTDPDTGDKTKIKAATLMRNIWPR